MLLRLLLLTRRSDSVFLNRSNKSVALVEDDEQEMVVVNKQCSERRQQW